MHEIRVIAPSDSWKVNREASYARAQKRFEDAGYQVTYGENVKSVLHLGTASAELRAKDFNDAFADKNVEAIIALHGGFSANEILPLIDWDIVKNNPKPFIGYSDITVLANAIYAKTGSTAFLGPNFGTCGYENVWQYSFDGVLNVLQSPAPYSLMPSDTHVDDRVTRSSASWTTVQEGSGEGILLGGNIQSFYLLQGTPYQPAFNHSYILAVEIDSLAGEYSLREFSRSFESILQLPGARQNIRGVIIGRFEMASKITDSELMSVIRSKHLEVPIISNVDFGHTTPIATLPIGGKVRIDAKKDNVSIEAMSY